MSFDGGGGEPMPGLSQESVVSVQPVPPAGAPAIDGDVLRDLLHQLGDSEGMQAELFDSYLAESKGQVSTLASAADAGDVVTLAAVAHSLRSSSAVLGATALADLLARLERVAGSRPAEVPALTSEVEAEHARVAELMAQP